MTPEEEKEVREIIAGIAPIATYRGPVTRLGGLTNRVYQLSSAVLRVPGKGTEEYINRAHEAAAARVASDAHVSPEVLYADVPSGLMVTRLVTNAVTMSPEFFKSRVGSPARAAVVLHKLHTSGGEFPFRFELFAMIDEYLKVLGGKDVDLPAGYHDVVREADVIRKALAKQSLPLVPCHCDPLCENFLDDGARMWVVDWEYSGMNDPMWDLGDLSVEGAFTSEQDIEMLWAYFGAAPSSFDHGRMVIYKAMCDLLWTLWGLIQHANKNPADDFMAYALNRFNRCKALMASSDFVAHVKAVQAHRTA
jgi:thiamine kinase-like enzyme